MGTHDYIFDNSSPNINTEMDLILMFTDSMWIILCSEMTVIFVVHTGMYKTYFIGSQTILYKKLIHSILLW